MYSFYLHFFLQMKNERKLWLHLLHFMVQHNAVAAAGPSIPLTKTRGLRQTWRKRKRKTLVHGSPIFIPSPHPLPLRYPYVSLDPSPLIYSHTLAIA